MSAKKDPKTNKWDIQYRYKDWQGENKKTTKRGFATKREAEQWVREFLTSQQADLTMSFEAFLKLYHEDITPRIKESTFLNKQNIMNKHILPYFAKKPMSEIKATDVRKWQNVMMKKGYKPTYLRTINNQLSALFNFAVKYYDLKQNPCTKAGSMGKNQADEMNFWTKEEFSLFIDEMMDKHRSYVGFKVLFWTGVRIGELLALTIEDVNLEEKTISITKSYQRIGTRDVVTSPKTPKSNRTLSIPDFLVADLKDYIASLYHPEPTDRLFDVTKHYFEREMLRGVKNSGVKRIRLHDCRHSHCALLFEEGFTALEIADRLGHEKVETTLNTYAHLYPNKQQQIAAKLDSVYMEEF